MKAEEDNEINNKLAEFLGKMKPYAKTILGVGLLLIAGLCAVQFVSASQAQKKSKGWQAYFDGVALRDPEEMRNIAESYGGTAAGDWSLQAAGDMHLSRGATLLYSDRDEAKQQLEAAVDAFEQVGARTGDSMLQQRSNFGLAQSYESLNQLAKAGETYDKIAANWPETSVGKKALERSEFVKRPATKEFYSWFYSQQPPAAKANAAASAPQVGSLPDVPDFNLPPAADATDTATDTDATTTKGSVTVDGATTSDVVDTVGGDAVVEDATVTDTVIDGNAEIAPAGDSPTTNGDKTTGDKTVDEIIDDVIGEEAPAEQPKN